MMAFPLTTASALAQNDKLGSWDITNLSLSLDKKFSLWLEAQTRSQKLTTDFYYHEFKGGIQYKLVDKATIMVGTGDYKTYSTPGNFKTPMQVKEWRLWEQLVISNNIHRVKLEHRYRIEQRWINGEFFNRFRYRINPIVPINHASIVPKTLYISAFDEVFFTNTAPFFVRNRFFAGAGFQFSKVVAAQAGWIRQFDYRKADDGSGKNFIQTSLLFTLDKRIFEKEHFPNTMD
ncbi:Protein of unknown function [Filimonas lacunae]|uniref:DUF2490 domain-containing protein n=1 Tax=Filimonas lacunae TaxID=477680 RepID=A0A173MAQ5_9BACT|nr:DUF2490 domain-containing protein [Filimonas lacunae]BAV04600.1 hypothetical protein FLA_0592 [Filimonas lacunae]SIT32700.1 Protein of unknown function [Filimonas lacunae]